MQNIIVKSLDEDFKKHRRSFLNSSTKFFKIIDEEFLKHRRSFSETSTSISRETNGAYLDSASAMFAERGARKCDKLALILP